MNTKLISRIVVAVVLGILLGLVLNSDIEARHQAGKNAYLAAQTRRWDRIYNHTPNPAAGVIVCVAGAVLVFGGYELLIAGVSWTIRKLAADESGAG